MKVIKLINEQKVLCTLSWDMIQVLEESIEDIKNNKASNRGIIMFLDSKDSRFVLDGWKKAGVLNSEAIALVELFKAEMIDLLKVR